MILVEYSFSVHPGKEEVFESAWRELTDIIYYHGGSLGSRLMKDADGRYRAHAQWPSRTSYDEMGQRLVAQGVEASERMRSACEEIRTEGIYELIEDATRRTQFIEPQATEIGRDEIISSEILSDEFFQVTRAQLRWKKYNGAWSDPVTRYGFVKGDAVAAAILDMTTRQVILVEQYRYPARAWVTEVVAGGLSHNEDPAVGIRREIMEESGYTVDTLLPVGFYHVSPGLFSERIHVYLAICTEPPIDNTELMDPEEDLKVVSLGFDQIRYFLGSVDDAKTMIALLAARDYLAELEG